MTYPLATISIGDDVFRWGDGLLQDVTLTLGEGAKSSSCAFTIFDPDRKLIDKYLARVEEIGGLEPIDNPEKNTRTDAGSKAGTRNGTLSTNQRAFLDVIAYAEGADYDVIVGGSKFTDFSDHPRRFNSSLGSDAAGRYQFISTTWDAFKTTQSFTPENQDAAALALADSFGALPAIEAGDIRAAVDLTGGSNWASLPNGVQSRVSYADVERVFKQSQQRYTPEGENREEAIESQVKERDQKRTPRSAALAGSQITIALGFDGQEYLKSAFLHTGIAYDQSAPHSVSFTGKAAVWVTAQRSVVNSYEDLSLREVAKQIIESRGLELKWLPENDGPEYEYLPQRGVSDYQLLLRECQRAGLRVTNSGKIVTIADRENTPVSDFVLTYAMNSGLTFNLSHEAQGGSSGGARSADPSERNPTGERKFELDLMSGQYTSISDEVVTGSTTDVSGGTTGSQVSRLSSILTSDSNETREQERNENRIKGITANFDTLTTPDLLTIDPDSVFRVEGFSEEIDRVWVIESITHALNKSGYTSSGTLYSPMRNKYPQPDPKVAQGSIQSSAQLNPGQLIKPSAGVLTSAFRTPQRPRHNGVDLAGARGDNIWAAKDGVVTDVENSCPSDGFRGSSCGGGYGNLVYIDHGDGLETRYAHMLNGSVTVNIGDEVKQGQVIGLEGNSGSSSGVHLHWEVRQNGNPINPASVVNL
jgi:murein DD-endopeptidase MepM/ murein hydrolase activator NlpD/muramidase (phage lysozyme)